MNIKSMILILSFLTASRKKMLEGRKRQEMEKQLRSQIFDGVLPPKVVAYGSLKLRPQLLHLLPFSNPFQNVVFSEVFTGMAFSAFQPFFPR